MKPSPRRPTAPRRPGTLGRLADRSSLLNWKSVAGHRLVRQMAAAIILLVLVGVLSITPVPAVDAAGDVVLRALTEDMEWASAWERTRAAVVGLPIMRDSAPSLSVGGTEAGEGAGPAFRSPLDGDLISPFGWRDDPQTGESRFHSGVDLAAPVGTPVKAAAAGRVARIWVDEEYGLAVEIEHSGDFRTLYAHLNRVTADEGQEVSSGDTIGTSGDSGRTSGPHLHFEIRTDDRAVDPLPLLGEGEE